jgi:hypothetical protein
MTHCLSRASKPLRPKNIYYQFSINRFIKEYGYQKFLIRSEKRYGYVSAKNSKHAKREFRKRYPKQKILTIKKLK